MKQQGRLTCLCLGLVYGYLACALAWSFSHAGHPLGWPVTGPFLALFALFSVVYWIDN
jgi:hypothetical protein